MAQSEACIKFLKKNNVRVLLFMMAFQLWEEKGELKFEKSVRVLGRIEGRTRAGVRLVRSNADGLPAEVLLGLATAAEDDLESRREVHHHHDDGGEDREHEHGHDEFETFALTLGEIADAAAFAERLAGVIRDHDIRDTVLVQVTAHDRRWPISHGKDRSRSEEVKIFCASSGRARK